MCGLATATRIPERESEGHEQQCDRQFAPRNFGGSIMARIIVGALGVSCRIFLTGTRSGRMGCGRGCGIRR